MAEYTEEHAKAGLDTQLPELETWPNQYQGYRIKIEIPEFTSLCPKSGLPDFGKLTLEYVPGQLCIELKSFKLYVLAYRDLGIFYENVVNRMLADVVRTISPVTASLTGEFTPRGGLSSTVTAHYSRTERE